MLTNSLDPNRVRYYVQIGLILKRIDETERILADLGLPPRGIALAILEDCRLSDVHNEAMAEEFTKELGVSGEYHRVTITAKEVDGWAFAWRCYKGYDD
jgi:hypothetical protein